MDSINIKFPLEDDTITNGLFEMNNVTKDALTSNGISQSDVEEEIRNTVRKYIPQLSISSVQIFTSADDEGNNLNDNQMNLLIDFKYTEDTFSENGRLELTI